MGDLEARARKLAAHTIRCSLPRLSEQEIAAQVERDWRLYAEIIREIETRKGYGTTSEPHAD